MQGYIEQILQFHRFFQLPRNTLEFVHEFQQADGVITHELV